MVQPSTWKPSPNLDPDPKTPTLLLGAVSLGARVRPPNVCAGQGRATMHHPCTEQRGRELRRGRREGGAVEIVRGFARVRLAPV